LRTVSRFPAALLTAGFAFPASDAAGQTLRTMPTHDAFWWLIIVVGLIAALLGVKYALQLVGQAKRERDAKRSDDLR